MTVRQKIGDLLVASGTIDEAQLEAALVEQEKLGRPLGMTLVRLGFLDEETLVNTLASQLKLPVVKLAGKVVNPDVLERVPIDLAEKHRCIPLLVNMEGGQQVLYLGMEDPANLDAIDELSSRTGDSIKPVLVAPSELEEALHRHYHWAENSTGSGMRIDVGSPVVAGDAEDEGEPEFIGLSGVATGPEQAPAASPADSASTRSAGVSSGSIVRALAQLLVEKGVITRDELVARVQSMLHKDDGAL
jgi:type IV pilus assembly protein PilB